MFVKFIFNIFKERKLIWQLAKNDCKARFASSGLGTAWAVLQPLVNILVIWFVFQCGFKSMPVDGIPFMVWYIPAFLIWNYFSETLGQATSSMMEYSYLVKKVNFKVAIIPIIKVISSGFIHGAFLIFIVVINLVYGRFIDIYYLQALYYFFCTIVMLLGLGWFFSAIAPFYTDVINLVGIVIQMGFWATPIFWEPTNMSPIVQFILKLNPMYYICQGYRDSFINKIWFWEHGGLTLYFWIFTIGILIIGITTFNRMKPHFDDVL